MSLPVAQHMASRAPTVADPDAACVARVLAGETAAFDELVLRYQRAIYAFCVRYVRHADDGRDVAQRTFVKAFAKLDSFRHEASFRAWLYRIATNLCKNHIRDRKRHVALTEATLVTAGDDGDMRVDAAQGRERLRRAVDALPPKQRLVVELRVYDDLSFAEVAEIAGCSENAAKVNFHHAVKHLRAWCSPPGDNDE
mgnify:CR=1 FL=1